MADGPIIEMLPDATRFIVRGDPAATLALGSAFGVELPQKACRAMRGGKRSALWLGPDEWLLLASDSEVDAVAAALGKVAASTSASVVDVSDRQVGIGVSGSMASDIVNAFNPLDLRSDAFPVDMCTRTIFGKAEVVLWRVASDAYHIEVWRSFAPYVLGCLDEAAREYA